MQATERAENVIFCPWWPWPSNSSKQGTTQVFCVNLAQIHSAVLEIFHTRKNHRLTTPKTTFHSWLRVVKTQTQLEYNFMWLLMT